MYVHRTFALAALLLLIARAAAATTSVCASAVNAIDVVGTVSDDVHAGVGATSGPQSTGLFIGTSWDGGGAVWEGSRTCLEFDVSGLGTVVSAHLDLKPGYPLGSTCDSPATSFFVIRYDWGGNPMADPTATWLGIKASGQYDSSWAGCSDLTQDVYASSPNLDPNWINNSGGTVRYCVVSSIDWNYVSDYPQTQQGVVVDGYNAGANTCPALVLTLVDTPTPAESPTDTATPTHTATATRTPTVTATATITPTVTRTPTETHTPTATPTPASINCDIFTVGVSLAPVGMPAPLDEGNDLDVIVQCIDQVGRGAIPSVVTIKLDRVSDSVDGTVLLPVTTLPAHLAMPVTIPASAIAMASDSHTRELQDLKVVWQWYPGECSVTITTECASDNECPGETCNPHQRSRTLRYAVTR